METGRKTALEGLTEEQDIGNDAATGTALPHITPHSLRRTYISIALVANNFDVKWVMSQVGHADSKMTLDVYAQLAQRIRRHHGESFDRLVSGARADLVRSSEPGVEVCGGRACQK